MQGRRAWTIYTILVVTDAYVVVNEFDPERDYTKCWKPCLFDFCKPICPDTTTMAPTAAAQTEETDDRTEPKIGTDTETPLKKTGPQINQRRWRGMSSDEQKRFTRGWGITCAIILLIMCIVETHKRITDWINDCRK